MMLFLVLLFQVSSTPATSFFIRPFPEIVKTVDNIARGRVGPQSVDWIESGSGNRSLFTLSQFQISEEIKGNFQGKRSIVLLQPGGQKGDLAMEVPGTAKFKTGDEVVLFLRPAKKDGQYFVDGMGLGKYYLVKDPSTQEEFLQGGALVTGVGPSSDGHDHEGEETHAPMGYPDENLKKWSLKALKILVENGPEIAPEIKKPLNIQVGEPETISDRKTLNDSRSAEFVDKSLTEANDGSEGQSRPFSKLGWPLLVVVICGVGFLVLRRK